MKLTKLVIVFLFNLVLFSVFLIGSQGIEPISIDETRNMPLIDTGLVKSEGISLDLAEGDLTHRCLQINISKGLSLDTVAGVLLDTPSKNNVNPILERKSVEYYNVTTKVLDQCTEEEIGAYPNSSKIINKTCTYTDKTETRQRDIWTNVRIDSTEIGTKRLDGVNLKDGLYKYCFDVPIVKTANGWGNSGEAQVVLDGKVYTDRQNSSSWNTTCANRKEIRINETSGKSLYEFDLNFSINTTGWANIGLYFTENTSNGSYADRKWWNETAFDSATTVFWTRLNMTPNEVGHVSYVYYNCGSDIVSSNRSDTHTYYYDFTGGPADCTADTHFTTLAGSPAATCNTGKLLVTEVGTTYSIFPNIMNYNASASAYNITNYIFDVDFVLGTTRDAAYIRCYYR